MRPAVRWWRSTSRSQPRSLASSASCRSRQRRSRSRASTLIAANLNPKVIQARLGHSSITETMDTYGHLFPEAEDLGRGVIDAALGEESSGTAAELAA
jgi:integrase